jgi:aryl-alcohol dehydrogenase-like predicted oxidoreductase
MLVDGLGKTVTTASTRQGSRLPDPAKLQLRPASLCAMDVRLDAVPMTCTGLAVSEICFGTWRFGRETDAGALETDRETAVALLDTYAAAGGRFLDTADVYGGGESERWLGEWLQNRDRDEFVVASKVYFPTESDDPNARGLSRKHVRTSVQHSLERLQTDYLDILYIHRWDENTPARELMRTLDALVAAGKVHHLGASTLRPNAWRIARANEIASREGLEQFSITQPRYNVVDREIEGEYLDFCRTRGIDVAPWSPLAQGFLTGKYERKGGLPGDSTASGRSPGGGRRGRGDSGPGGAGLALSPPGRHRPDRRRAHRRPAPGEPPGRVF